MTSAGVVRTAIVPMVVVMGLLVPDRVAAQTPEDVAGLLRTPTVKAAIESARASEPRTLGDQVRFCEVPAPPFHEAARADLLQRAFIAARLENVRIDKAGNVIGDFPGATPRPRVVIAAHLDTVFPEGTTTTVTRSANVLRGPGIGDNCRGLAVLVAIARVMKEARI